MFERYTERARRVVHWARYMAGRVGSTDIETEHLLLGLLRQDQGLGNRFLGSPWGAEEVWKRIRQSKPLREKISGPVDMPLSNESKHALAFAAEEADLLSSKPIRTEHILLGLLRDEKCFAAQILRELGVHLGETREELMRTPHNEAAKGNFVRELGPRPADVVELQNRIRSIRIRMEEAIGKHDFAAAKMYSDQEGEEHDKLFLLCERYGLLDWIYD